MRFLVHPALVLVLGLFFVALGILIIVFREPVQGWMGAEQRRLFGKLGAAVTRRAKPSHLIPGAVVMIVLGAFAATTAGIRLLS